MASVELTPCAITNVQTDTSKYENQSRTISIDVDDGKKIIEQFEPNDTLLHKLFGSNVGPKIMQIIYHKYVMAIGGLLIISGMIIPWLGLDGYIIYTVSLFGCFWCFMVLILFILSVNRTALRLILRSFEFWFKFANAIALIVLWILIQCQYKPDKWLVINTILRVLEVLAVILFSILDGLQWPLKSKFIIGFLMACNYSIYAIVGTLFWEDKSQTVIQITDTMKFKLLSMTVSVYRVLAIFIWKQTILSVWKRKKATIVKYSPYIEWAANTSHEYDITPSLRVNAHSFNNDD